MKIAILGANPNCGNRGVNALAYSIVEILNEVLKDKTKEIYLNVSSLLWNGGYSGNNQFELKCNYQQAIYNIIEKLLEDEKIIIHLVPHVFSDNLYEVENDYAISKILTSHYDNKRVTLSPYFFDPCEAKSYISGMNFFVGARMHACIAAFVRTFRKDKNVFMRWSCGGRLGDSSIFFELLNFRKRKLLLPIPSFSTHSQKPHVAKLVDWEMVINEK